MILRTPKGIEVHCEMFYSPGCDNFIKGYFAHVLRPVKIAAPFYGKTDKECRKAVMDAIDKMMPSL